MRIILSKALRSTVSLILAAAVGGLVAAFWLSPTVFQIAGTSLEASIFPSKKGLTQLSIPPLGEIKAETHSLPVGISLSLERVSLGRLQRLASVDISQQELLDEVETELTDAGRWFFARLLALAAVGGLMSGLILPGRNWKRAAAAAGVGLFALAFPAYIVIGAYDLKAWRQPKYSGMLTAAPWLLGTIEDKFNDLDAFRAEMRNLARNLHSFYAKVEGWEPVRLGNGHIKVLHVSDVHNNPAALDLIARVARDFQVDFIIDTGDLTDLGTPLEASLVARVGELGVPYVFVPGNHDSQAVIDALRQKSNVLVADNKMVEVKGLKIFGAVEPAAYQPSAEPAKGKHLSTVTRAIAVAYQGLPEPPDIVAVHAGAQARKLIGKVKVVLSGHTHRPSLRIKRGTLIDDVGTSGAAGVRSFEVEEGLPYSLRLHYFDHKSRELTAVDSLTFSGQTREFILERRLISPESRELPNLGQSASLDISWRTNQ